MSRALNDRQTTGGLRPGNRPNMDGFRGALWLPVRADKVPAYLLEEGCHSAGFDTTIHIRHHLLLS